MTTFLVAKNRAYSKLAAAIDADDTEITVKAGEGANFPSTYPFHITIDDEIMSCVNRSTDTLTVTRAQQSTSAAAHANKSYLALNITAKSITDLNTAVNTIEGYFTDGFTVPTNKHINFRDTGMFIYSPSDGVLTMQSDGTLSLDATTVVQIGSVAITLTGAVTITGAVSVIGNITMGTNKVLYFRDTGLSIYSPSNGVLSIGADTTLAMEGVTNLNLDGAAIHITGVVTITGATTITGAIGLVGNTTVNTNKYLYFRDTGLSIYSPSDGVLSIGSDATLALEGITALNLDSTTIHLTGVVNVTGATAITGTLGVTGFGTMVGNNRFQFRDTGMFIYSPSDGVFTMQSDGTLALVGTTVVQIGGPVTMDSTLSVSGVLTLNAKMNEAVAFSLTTGNESGYQLTITDATIASADMHRGLVVTYTASGAKTGTSDIEGISVDMFLNGNTITAYPMAVYIADTGNNNHDVTAGYTVYIENLGSGSLGNIVGLDIGLNATNLATGRHTGIRIRSHSGVPKSAIDVESAFLVGIDFYNGQTAGNFTTADIRFHHGATLLDDGTNLTLVGAILVVPVAGLKVGTSLVTLAGAFTTVGAYSLTLTQTATTNVTLPTTGTLATLAGAETFTAKLGYNGLVITADTGVITTGTWNGTTIAVANGGTGVTASTGTVAVVLSNTPTLVTPILGVASATSLATSAAIPLLLTNGQLVNVALTSQTVGATTLTIPNFASVSDTFVFATLSQELANKTLNASVLKGTFTASGTVTFPAITLGATVTINGQIFDAGTGNISINTTGYGFEIYSTNNGIEGSRISCYHITTSPAVDDVPMSFYVQGKDSAGNDTAWSFCKTVVVDPVNGQEDAKLTWGLMNVGTFNDPCMTLSGAGDLWIDRNLLMDTGYIRLTEMAAPGALGANTVGVYAIVGGDTLTDLAAVFQDGTVDIFAQEATDPDSPIFQFPDMTELKLTMRKPDQKTVQFAAIFPDGREFIMRELRYPVNKWN